MKKDATYDLVALTSMGLRITPLYDQPVHTSRDFTMQVTSAESNVLTLPASLGCKTKVLTAFVKDNQISTMIKQDLRRRNIEVEGPSFDKGGPWGYRHQINIAGSGFGYRKPVVTNDRAGEVAAILHQDDVNWNQLFFKDGVKILHVSGLFAGISKETLQFTIDMIKKAKETGTLISFDINFRASFWKNRYDELKEGFNTIVSQSNIIFGNEEDYQKALDIKGPDRFNNLTLEDYKPLLLEVAKTYPNLSHISCTLRDVKHAKRHLWGAISLVDGSWYTVEPQPIEVFDRIGGGDGFAGGYLYGILTDKTMEETIQFAWATGAYTVTLLYDFAEVTSEEDIWQVWYKNARVKR